MKILLATMLLGLVPTAAAAGRGPLACNLTALSKDERATHSKLMLQMAGAVQETKELRDGYAFRLAPGALATTAQWVALESRCCPFFAFELELESHGGPLWLRIRGAEGVKAFIREELGL
jgi:hypothetical protein